MGRFFGWKHDRPQSLCQSGFARSVKSCAKITALSFSTNCAFRCDKLRFLFQRTPQILFFAPPKNAKKWPEFRLLFGVNFGPKIPPPILPSFLPYFFVPIFAPKTSLFFLVSGWFFWGDFRCCLGAVYGEKGKKKRVYQNQDIWHAPFFLRRFIVS